MRCLRVQEARVTKDYWHSHFTRQGTHALAVAVKPAVARNQSHLLLVSTGCSKSAVGPTPAARRISPNLPAKQQSCLKPPSSLPLMSCSQRFQYPARSGQTWLVMSAPSTLAVFSVDGAPQPRSGSRNLVTVRIHHRIVGGPGNAGADRLSTYFLTAQEARRVRQYFQARAPARRPKTTPAARPEPPG